MPVLVPAAVPVAAAGSVSLDASADAAATPPGTVAGPEDVTSPITGCGPTGVDKNRQPKHTLNVGLTGFGPFRQFKTNPSWQALEPLNGCSSELEDGRQVKLSCFEIPVVYDEVLARIPALFGLPHKVIDSTAARGASYPPPSEFDLIVHVGVAPGRHDISMERRARRFGYSKRDHNDAEARSAIDPISGNLLQGFIDQNWAGSDAGKGEIHTILDVNTLARRISEAGIAPTSVSDDAGCFLCEFIYYAGLAGSIRSANETNKPRIPVLFIHVPPEGEPYSIQELTHILHSTVMLLASSI